MPTLFDCITLGLMVTRCLISTLAICATNSLIAFVGIWTLLSTETKHNGTSRMACIFGSTTTCLFLDITIFSTLVISKHQGEICPNEESTGCCFETILIYLALMVPIYATYWMAFGCWKNGGTAYRTVMTIIVAYWHAMCSLRRRNVVEGVVKEPAKDQDSTSTTYGLCCTCHDSHCQLNNEQIERVLQKLTRVGELLGLVDAM